jgi:hypothetical protein
MMKWEELLERKKEQLQAVAGNFQGKVLGLEELRKMIGRRTKRGKGFRKFVGKEIIIKDIQFNDGKAIVKVETDGKEKLVETEDKALIKRWLIDFKIALDEGAKGIKVKVEPLGSGGVKFV